MKKDKMTEVLTFRTSKETKELLEYFAEEKDWSISQLIERTITKWVQEQKKILLNELNIEEEQLSSEDIEEEQLSNEDIE